MELFGISVGTLVFALLGGVIPTFIWLYFWLKEDRKNPEPKGLLFITFLGGMLSVLLILPVENFIYTQIFDPVALVTATAFAEEIIKYLMVAILVLHTRFVDEPVDPAVYMITGALGFAALENTLFLIEPILSQDLAVTFFTGNLRFLGATILHVVTSAIVGIAMGLAFHKRRRAKRIHLVMGLLTAGILHSLFNFFIMNSTLQNVITIFGSVWVVAVIIMLLFEKLKRMEPHHKRLRAAITSPRKA